MGAAGNMHSIDHTSGKHSSSFQMASKHNAGASSNSNLGTGSMQKFSGQAQSSKMTGQQLIEQKAKRQAQRPFSGGVQKMLKSDNHKSRVQNLNQKNFSMYENKAQSIGVGHLGHHQSSNGQHSASSKAILATSTMNTHSAHNQPQPQHPTHSPSKVLNTRNQNELSNNQ
jgi:hypothetical protein